jgi:hypothetical protein
VYWAGPEVRSGTWVTAADSGVSCRSWVSQNAHAGFDNLFGAALPSRTRHHLSLLGVELSIQRHGDPPASVHRKANIRSPLRASVGLGQGVSSQPLIPTHRFCLSEHASPSTRGDDRRLSANFR